MLQVCGEQASNGIVEPVSANYREARLSDLYEQALVAMFLNLLVLKFD
jgi:hypothetical protein